MEFIDKIINFLSGIIGVIVGWKLSWKTIVKQRSVEHLQQKFDALSQIKSVVDNIPPNLNKNELSDKCLREPEFLNSLVGRLTRLFGLRNELMPYVESEFIDLIDKEFQPLFNIETGTYNFKGAKIMDFTSFTEKIILYVHSAEKKLRKNQKEQLK